jgi:uncharacterized membrane protein
LLTPQPSPAPSPREFAREWAGPVLLAATWAGVYVWRAFRAHAALQTNAFDLSLFDYTLWNTLHGRPGFVPFMHSIFSHHFMPIIVLMSPLYAIWPSPEWVIVIQTTALAGAAVLFFALARRLGLGRPAALALMFVLLISRRSHSAAVSYFYFESLQPALMFLLVLSWLQERWRLFWIAVLLLLTTKEDMPLFLGAFAAVQWRVAPQHRRRLLTLGALAVTWMIAAVTVAIPLSRHIEGLSGVNPLLGSRLGAVSPGLSGAGILLGRIFGAESLRTVFSLLASAGLLSLLAPRWLLVAAPATLLCLSLASGNMQTAILGHYAMPILPWVFLSAAVAVQRLSQRAPVLAKLVLIALVAGTLADAPIVRYGWPAAASPEAAEVLRQLRQLPPTNSGIIAVQPNLIPHLPHSNAIRALDAGALAGQPDQVLLAPVGNLWPYSPAELSALIGRYRSDPDYEQVLGGPLYLFKRRVRHP